MTETCLAVLNIKGEHFGCDTEGSHGTHSNVEAKAIWVSDTEAREIDEAHPDARRKRSAAAWVESL